MNTTLLPDRIDRASWRKRGPWDAEPDKEQFRTGVGLPGLIVRNPLGGLCGYVGVAPGHPYYGRPYNDCTRSHEDWGHDGCDAPDAVLEVHGGITYADYCQGDICHVPEPGEADRRYWFGFDCMHANDLYPCIYAYATPDYERYVIATSTYRDWAYVRDWVESLAVQLAAVELQATLSRYDPALE